MTEETVRLWLAERDMVTLTREQLQAIFDLAVHSMDFGSGFWDETDILAARAIATVLGVDPMNATPSNYCSEFNHPLKGPDWRGVCGTCLKPPDWDAHIGGKRD